MTQDLTADAIEKNGKHNHLVTVCLDLYQEFKDSKEHQKKVDEAKVAREIYEQIEEDIDFPWKDAYNFVIPVETITIDNVEPRLAAGIVGKTPYVTMSMKGQKSQDKGTELVQDWFQTELNEVVKIQDAVRHIVHTILLDGTIYVEAEYTRENSRFLDFRFDDQGNVLMDELKQEPFLEWVEEPSFDGVKLSFESMATILHADDVDEWEKADYIKIINPSYAELKRANEDPDSEGYMNIEPYLLSEEKSQDINEKSDETETPAQTTTNVEVTGREGIECIECHISYIRRDAESQDQVDEAEETDFTETKVVATIAVESGIIIRFQLLTDINFKNEHPLKRIRLFPELGRALGTSMHTKLKSVQGGVSDVFNMALNIATVTVMPWYFYSNKAGIKGPSALKPGIGVECDDPSQVVFPTFNVNPAQLMPFIEMFLIFWERLGSIGDAQIGRTKAGDSGSDKTTATEFLGILEEGNIKHDYQSKTFKSEFISLLRTIYDLYYKNLPLDFKYQTGAEGEEEGGTLIPRKLMQRGYEFRLTGSTELANKMVQLSKAEKKYAALRQDPLADGVKLLKDYAHNIDPDENEDDIINPQINEILMMLEKYPQLYQNMQEEMKNIDEARTSTGENVEKGQ